MTKTCPICEKVFEQNSNIQKYCSENCRRKAHRNAENIKRHTKSFWEREEIYDHFHHRCAICGWEITTQTDGRGRRNNSHGCEIHHIISTEEGGGWTADNLILLCPNCHKKADYGIVSRDELRAVLRQIDEDENVRKYFLGEFGKLSDADQNKCLRYMEGLLPRGD